MKATLCKTKAGRGFKLVLNGVWIYASKEQLHKFLEGESSSCQFKEIKEEEAYIPLLYPCEKGIISYVSQVAIAFGLETFKLNNNALSLVFSFHCHCGKTT